MTEAYGPTPTAEPAEPPFQVPLTSALAAGAMPSRVRQHPRAVGGTARGRQTSVRRVRSLIRAAIAADSSAETKLDENVLVRELDASRSAVREALQQLRDEGLLARRQRVGTRVSGAVLQLPLYELLIPDLEGSFKLKWTEVRTVPATVIIKENLNIESAEVNLVECLVLLGDEILGVNSNYLAMNVSEIPMPTVARTLQDAFLLTFGRDLGTSTNTIESTACDSQTARLLRVPVGSPLLTRMQTLYDVDGNPHIVQFSHFRGDRVSFKTSTIVPH